MASTEDHLAQIDIFSGLGKTELRRVSKLMTAVTIKAGKEFISEGASGREAFIILDGRATVRRGGRVVASVGPGDVLGEMTVLTGAHRTASVTADTDIQAEVLSRREFSSLLDDQPKLAKKLLIGVLERLHQLEPSVIG